MNKLTERWFPLVGATIITMTSFKFIEYSEINFFAKDLWLSCFSCDKPYLSFTKVKPGKAFNDSLV